MKTACPSVLIVAALTLYRTGLVALLHQRWPALTLTLTADTAQLVGLVQARPFQLVIIDAELSERALPTLLQHLHQIQPRLQLVVLAPGSSPFATTIPTRLILPRDSAPSHLAATLAPWLDNIPSSKSQLRAQRPSPTRFSPRELEVLRLVVDDCCNQEIANHLYLSVRTIESHRRALLHKSGTRTLAGLVAWALREGMIA